MFSYVFIGFSDQSTIDEIMILLESIKNMVLNAKFNEIIISSKNESEEERGDDDDE